MYQEKNFLIEKGKLITFELKNTYSFIIIKKIIIDSLWGTDHWISEIAEKNIHLNINYSNPQGMSRSYPLSLIARVSPMHRNPVFEFDDGLILPEENFDNKLGLRPHFSELTIEAVTKDDSLKMTIIYEVSPGAILIKK